MSNRMIVAAVAVLLLLALFGFLTLRSLLRDSDTTSAVDALAASAEANPAPAGKNAAADPAPAGKGAVSPAAPKTAAPAEKPLCDGWPKPAAAIVFSGEQHGYIEPCGCSLHQLGGLSRRGDLLRQLGERGWLVTAFDGGGLVNNPTRRQGKFKFDMVLKCLADMHYAGVAVGVEELQLSFDFLTRPEEPPFLACNLVLFGDPTIQGGPLTQRVVQVGEVKIGVTAVFGPSLQGVVVPGAAEGTPRDFEVADPAASIGKALAALEAEKPDLLVLLSHAHYDETKKIAESFPQFDIILTSDGPEDPEPKPIVVGKKTLLVAPGQKGKYVMVVGYYPDGGNERLRFERVALDEDRFQDTPAIVEHMRYYQEDMLKQNELVATEPAIDDPRPTPTAAVNEFVGAKVCGECHKSALEVWEGTKHAHATETLKTGHAVNSKPWINRVFDPECVACHVTGWDPRKFVRYKSGYTDEKTTSHLAGQQCENCHGPGGRHTELEHQFAKDQKLTDEIAAWRKYHRLAKKTALDLCTRCHDGDNDPNFNAGNFDAHWDEIAHPGKD